MGVHRSIVVFVFLFLLAVNAGSTFAQDPGEDEKGDFTVTTSVSLGLSGLTTSTDYKLVDELGFEYDVISLLRNQKVKEMTGIEESQMDRIDDLWTEATRKMNSKFVESVVIEQDKSEIKRLFLESQEQMLELLEPDQIERLQQASHHVAIERYGIANYLASNRMQAEIELSDGQLKSLRDAESKFNTDYRNRVRSLIVKANETLLESLTDFQRKTIRESLGKSGLEDFKKAKLFTSANSIKGKPIRNQSRLIGLTRRSRIRSDLGIERSQYESIMDLSRLAKTISEADVASRLKEILHPEQLHELERVAALEQVGRLGTVDSLSYGMIGQKLDLKPGESEELFAMGEQIQHELLAASNEEKSKSIKETMPFLSDEMRDRVVSIVGDVEPSTR